jgi:predicted dehydrogenase
MKKLNIALFCDGTIGEEYLETISSMEQFHLVGYHGSINNAQAQKSMIPFFGDDESLIEQSDAVIILMPPTQQFEIAKKSLKKLKHLFIEKPLTSNIDELETLLSMQREANVKIQMGSGIRATKEFMEFNKKALKPLYIETQNFSTTIDDSSNVPVVLNLMLDDIDIALALVKSEVQKINAIGVGVVNDTPDIVNARLEFGNGCVVTLTAGRISIMDIHSTSLFLKDNCIMLDFTAMQYPDHPISANKTTVQRQATETLNTTHKIKGKEDITAELFSFYDCITKNVTPPVTLYDGFKSLKLAYQIIDKIEERGMEK